MSLRPSRAAASLGMVDADTREEERTAAAASD